MSKEIGYLFKKDTYSTVSLTTVSGAPLSSQFFEQIFRLPVRSVVKIPLTCQIRRKVFCKPVHRTTCAQSLPQSIRIRRKVFRNQSCPWQHFLQPNHMKW